MFLKSIYLRNFRSYEEDEFHFDKGLNLFYGDNGSGKTNLLEAVYFIATGKSFRTQHLSEMIRIGCEFFFLGAEIVRDGVTQTIQVSFGLENRKCQIDANTYSSFQPLLGLLPSVLYTPYDIELISGSPNARRRFLNLHLAQSDPLYVHHLTRFWRAMKQRNCLLRARKKESLDCWEAEMAQSASYLWKLREEMILDLKEPLEKESQFLSSKKETHELRYAPIPSDYTALLQKNRHREMELGLTLAGPHRDDFSILIEGKPARLFASEGQKKTAIAALRLAEWERLSQRTQTKALLGIDDLNLHLDETRQELFMKALEQLGQVFITSPYLLKNFSNGHCLKIEGKPLREEKTPSAQSVCY